MVVLAVVCICCLFGCSSETSSGNQGAADVGSGTQPDRRPEQYRFRNEQGREQFDIPVLVADLKGNDSRSRIAAAKVIPFNAPKSFEPAIEPLIALLGSGSEVEKQAAAEGISRLTFGSPSLSAAFEPLKRIVEGRDSDVTRRWAMIALSDIGPSLPDDQQAKLIELLQASTADASYDVARFAMEGLGNLGPRVESAIPAILVQLDAGEHRTLVASHALEQIHCRPDLCVPSLIRALAHSPKWTEYILRALSAFGSDAAPAVPAIRRLLASGDGNVLIAASCVLSAIGPAADDATDDLARAFKIRPDATGAIRDEARIAILSTLNSVGPKGKAKALEILSQIHELRLIQDSRIPMRPEVVLGSISNSSGITTLLLSGSNLTDNDLASVASLANLRELALPQSITNDSLRCVSGLSKLQILKQDLWNHGGSQNNLLDDSAMVHLRDCSRLRTLALRICLTGTGTRHLAGCPELESLTVLQMNDEAIRNLPPLNRLDTLNINGGAVTDKGVGSLKRISTLKHLSLQSTDVTDVGIDHLTLNHPGLLSLNLAHVSITDASVPALSRLKKLTQLIVYATPLAGDRHILDMRMTPAIVQLKAALPDCTVTYAD